MDDCDLEKLAVKPGKLTPAFHKNTLEYNVIIASDVDKIFIDPLTSDSGASYSIPISGGSKQITLKEGAVTDIKIDVSAEDGTTKSYVIHAKRLSAKDASLTSLIISSGKLDPAFSPDRFDYTCLLPCDITEVLITPTAPDTKITLMVGSQKPDTPTDLNFGDTIIPIQVTSADGSTTQVYNIHITRKPFPRFVKIMDKDLALNYECPITLCPLYRPISIKGSQPLHVFSAPLIDEYTKTSKFDPLSNMPLASDWRVENHELDAKISSLSGCVPLTYGGQSQVTALGKLGSVLKSCDTPLKSENLKDKFKDTKLNDSHSVQVRKWEKGLHQIFDETDVNVLSNTAKQCLKQYFKSLPRPGQSCKYDEGETPLDHLNQAAYNLATAIKFSGKQHALHHELAMVQEERYYAEDLFGLKKESVIEEICLGNKEAQESSKREEALAICQLRGVESSAPLSLQLKAIDEEYHDLVNSGQSGKADHVMSLYAWYSKTASQEGIAARKAADEESSLGQAFMKYLDSVSLDQTKAAYHFDVGRMLVMQSNYPEAVARLEVTLFWNAQHQLSRFYLGLALAMQKDGPGKRSVEAIGYLLEAMEALLTENSKQAQNPDEFQRVTCLHANNLIRVSNVHLLRGIVQLGKLLAKNLNFKDAMSPKDVFHTAGLLASQVLPTLAWGDTYHQVEWVLMEAHSSLLDLLGPTDVTEISQRCHRLSALIFHSTIEKNAQLIELQERTCQRIVRITPCSSQAMTLLGCAQFDRFDHCQPGDSTATKLLDDAIASFRMSIALEGQPMEGEPHDLLKGQKWWKALKKEEEEAKKNSEEKNEGSASKPTGQAGRGGAVAARGGAAATKGGAAAARGRGVPARGGAVARGTARGGATAAAARGGARGAKAGPPGKTSTPLPASKTCMTDKKPEAKSAPAVATEDKPAATSKPVELNPKSYQPRLGLARALKAASQMDEAQKYYEEVISMASYIHDAYIEGAEMLSKSKPLAAVDMYSKFPVPKEPSFDDAYIFGEIIRLLMKAEKYDDPRLGPNMIAYGRVLGLASLEKYVNKLEEVFKPELLKSVYAGVNKKSVDDPDLQPFFKMKCWI
ncbi:uncharacterized protein LOC121372183 [Gigantopelta aegis]|uniref:uncharacterized protein LOC121372183 n=1 Tax=Gigantopelta aegis TaxID=1735272 RepID=UPI001B889666|nr:uncharacterized protein LOC121372183 [Gigantopelta aegis]